MYISRRSLFLKHVGQTGPMPVMLDIDRAENIFIYDKEGKRYFDLNSGISVSSIGHCHPSVVKAIQSQSAKYMHTMVYGEHLQSPQLEFAQRLTDQLDPTLNAVYYLMAGTEATELAMKLAKRYTGRTEIIACRKAYHGSTQGAESLRSDEDYKQAFYPLLPDISHIGFNNEDNLERITERTACVILEPVQAESGVITPNEGYLEAVRQRCSEVGALMILDEIQTGFGRTGELFAHQKYSVVPDVMLIGKAMGGGMPIAGVVSSQTILGNLTRNPMLGHITTFGGHPVCCAAASACLQVLDDEQVVPQVEAKGALFVQLLQHPIVKEVRQIGMMMAIELTKRKYLKHVVHESMNQGAIIDYFLFNNRSLRLAPPLIITEEQIHQACALLQQAFDFAYEQYSR